MNTQLQINPYLANAENMVRP